jgi:acetylornithine/succinyldiaminopimelate/putrescine aminotransferase
VTDWQAVEQQLCMRIVSRQPVTLVRGDGMYVWDDQGKEYLDFFAGIAVNALGHCHPALVRAITEQAQVLIHASNIYYTVPQLQLAEVLLREAGLDRIFFGNSGAEAMEACIKLARKYGKLHRNGAHEVIVMTGAFHGRTLAAVTATANPHYQEPFTPLAQGFPRVAFNDLEAARRAVTDKTVGIMLELIQGEGGVLPADVEYVRGLRRLCDERGLLLILDEVQTGIGRTGSFYAFQQYGIKPDVVGLAKQLGGGLPIGAIGGRAELMDLLAPVGSVYQAGTYAAHPHAMAAGIAVLEVLANERTFVQLEITATALAEGLTAGAKAAGVEATVVRAGTFLSVFFAPTPPRNFGDVDASDKAAFGEFHRAMRADGVLIAPSPFEAWFPSLAHTEADIDRTIDAAASAFERVKATGDAP